MSLQPMRIDVVEDQDKTKEQLIDELTETRRRLTELEALEAKRRRVEVEHEYLLTSEREQRVLTEALHWAGAVLGSTLNYDKVLDHIMEQVGRILSYKAACLLLVEGKTARVFRWRGYERFGAVDSLSPASFDIDDIPILHTIRETGWPVALPYVEEHDAWRAKSGQRWIKSSIKVAIRTRLRLIGFLHVDSDIAGSYSQADAERLQTFADQAAIALENARRYDRARQEIARRVKELKKERNFVSAILDTAGALVVVLDAEGHIVRFNRACEQITGYSSDEVIGKLMWDLFLIPEEIEATKAIMEALQSGQHPIAYENHWVTNKGEQRLIAWSNTALFDQGGAVDHIICTGIDITERRQSEQEREKLIEDLDAFAHTVAHDLQGPVALMIGFASALIEYSHTMSPDEFREHLQAVLRNGRKMTNIIEELLLLAGVRKREVQLAPLDMAEIVAEAQERLADMIDKHQVRIILPETWPVALGYAPWIEEVWVNYVSNAIKYGGTPPRVELGATEQENGQVGFWVRDNGPGLTAEDQDKLFAPFTQINQARAKGQGLGLSIVRRIIEKLGGQVAVESAGVPGQGSLFSFVLPRVDDRSVDQKGE